MGGCGRRVAAMIATSDRRVHLARAPDSRRRRRRRAAAAARATRPLPRGSGGRDRVTSAPPPTSKRLRGSALFRSHAMIIQSLLDTDLYKFTMMQVVLHHFPGAQVEYRFKCRNANVDLRPYIDEIRQEIKALCSLRFGDSELAYLRSMRFIKSDFVDFLSLFQMNEK